VGRMTLAPAAALFIALFTAVGAPAAAQEPDGLVVGRVVSVDGGQPLEGAQVFIVGSSRGVLTGSDGAYRLVVPPGTYVVRAVFLGHQDREERVSLQEGQVVTVDFSLAPGVFLMDELVVTGTRTQRSALETTVPVDVIRSVEIQRSPHTELNQVIRDLVPSFHASHQTVSDGTDHVDPASLRGLGPDQLLVLVNGKRRHHSALTHVNGTFGRGTVGVDLNAIPLSAVERIEVLRDGAASLYGSDAIAGVINIVLKEGTGALTGSVQTGVTGEGDGEQVKAGLNVGFEVGERGFFNVSGELLNRESTNRSEAYTGSVFFSDPSADDAEIARRGLTRDHFSMRTGQGDATLGSMFFNGAFPISTNAEIYAFGGVTHRQGAAPGFYRRPIQEERVVFELYPNGFLPEIHSGIQDQAATVGLRGKKGAWDMDVGLSHGRNAFQLNIENTVNASMGAASPVTFDAGSLEYSETTGAFDLVRLLDTDGALRSLSLVMGGEFRLENYRIHAGQFESYSLGNGGSIPGVDYDTTSTGAPKAAGSQVFPGFQPFNEVDRSRNNLAAYGGIEAQISTRVQVDAGGRFERYNGCGG